MLPASFEKYLEVEIEHKFHRKLSNSELVLKGYNCLPIHPEKYNRKIKKKRK